MNNQDLVGSLADGGTYRVTPFMVEITKADGAPAEAIDRNDIKETQRKGNLVTIKRRKGKDVTIEGVSLDDAGRLEVALRGAFAAGMPPAPVASKKGGGIGRFLMIGCGGLIGLVVLIFIVVAATSGSGDGNQASSSSSGSSTVKTNEATLVEGQSATAENIKITIQNIADPYVSSNQFSKPSEGNRFVAYKVTFENMGSRQASVNPFSFKVRDAENFEHKAEAIVFAEQSLMSQTTFDLGGGAKVEGWIGFEVKEGVAVKQLEYDPNAFTNTDHIFRAPGQ